MPAVAVIERTTGIANAVLRFNEISSTRHLARSARWGVGQRELGLHGKGLCERQLDEYSWPWSVCESVRCQFVVLAWRDGRQRNLRDETGNTANTYIPRTLISV